MRYTRTRKHRKKTIFSLALLKVFAVYMMSYYSLAYLSGETNALFVTGDSTYLNFEAGEWEAEKTDKEEPELVFLTFTEEVNWDCESKSISAEISNPGVSLTENEEWKFEVYHVSSKENKENDDEETTVLIDTGDVPMIKENESIEVIYDLTEYLDQNEKIIDFGNEDTLAFAFKLIYPNEHPTGKAGEWSEEIIIDKKCEKKQEDNDKETESSDEKKASQKDSAADVNKGSSEKEPEVKKDTKLEEEKKESEITKDASDENDPADSKENSQADTQNFEKESDKQKSSEEKKDELKKDELKEENDESEEGDESE